MWIERSALQVAAACVLRVQGALGAGFFAGISFFSPINAGTLLYQWCVLGEGTSPSCALLHSGVNEYLVLVGQRWQLLYDKLLAPNCGSAVWFPGS